MLTDETKSKKSTPPENLWHLLESNPQGVVRRLYNLQSLAKVLALALENGEVPDDKSLCHIRDFVDNLFSETERVGEEFEVELSKIMAFKKVEV